MMLTVRCACKRQHTDRSEVTNGYGVLCGCESGIFENVPTREGEECKVCSIKTRARLARDDSEYDSGNDSDDSGNDSGDSGDDSDDSDDSGDDSDDSGDDSDDSENGSATATTAKACVRYLNCGGNPILCFWCYYMIYIVAM